MKTEITSYGLRKFDGQGVVNGIKYWVNNRYVRWNQELDCFVGVSEQFYIHPSEVQSVSR